jgi:NADPH2:quinone reductase
MRTVVATPGGPHRTELRDIDPPEPAPNEAVVAVRAFSVNRGELRLLASRDEGWRPGQDVAGDVVRAAADGSGPREGDRVAGLADWHGWAERVAVPTHRLAVIPEGVDYATAAALPMAGSTAANLVRLGGSLLGQRVLVTGASGGVGHLAVQLAGLAGARVTSASSAADAPQSDGRYDLILESAGGPSLTAAVDRVAAGGAILLFGNSSGQPSEVDFRAFAGREASIQSYFSAEHEAEAGRNLGLLLDLVSAGRLHVEIGLRESWTQLNEALEALAERRVAGKVVLLVD